MRWLGWFVGAICALLLLAVAGVTGALWLGLPRIDGEMHMAGLKAPVTVTRDRRGIPYIKAASEEDAAYALGVVHAQDRFAQMEMMRRLVSGRLAEVVGPAALESDRFMRILGLARLAEGSVTQLSAEAQALLAAYAEGVNAALGAQLVQSPELIFMGAALEPWRPSDSLLWHRLMALQLTGNWRDELSRAALSRKLTPEQLRDLYDRTADGAHVPLAAAIDPEAARRLLAAIPDEARPRTASNIWLLAGSRSDSGKPLLANDPHLSLTMPNLWYLARIETPSGLRVGATAPGVPFTVLGHNGRIAWGLTTTHGDTADLMALPLSGEDGYMTADGPAKFTLRPETIRIRGAAPVEIVVRDSRFGPIVSDSRRDMAAPGHAVALLSTSLAPDDRTAEALWRLTNAGTVAEAQAVLAADFHSPQQNVGIADTEGHIGLFVSGRVPVRDGDGWMPGTGGWSGWRAPAPDLAVIDPPSGRIVNANNTPVPDPLAHGLGQDFDAPYRARRIDERLAGVQSAADMAALQSDAVSTMARDALPVLLRLTPRTEANAAALDRLAAWNFDMRRERPEPLIFTAWWRHLLRALYADEMGDSWGDMQPRPGVVLRSLTLHTQWCDDIRTPAAETCAQRLDSSLAEALAELRGRHGESLDKWRWGEVHRARLTHPIFGRVPYLASLFRVQVPTDGDNWTVNRAQSRLLDDRDPYGNVHGAGYRAVYDLARLDDSLFQSSLGQSAHRLSPHFSDLAQRWADGAPFTIGATPERPTGTLTLRPH
jgi:penicillin amidase